MLSGEHGPYQSNELSATWRSQKAALCENVRRLGWEFPEGLVVETPAWSLRLAEPARSELSGSQAALTRVTVPNDVLAAMLAGQTTFYQALAAGRLWFSGDDWAALRLAGVFSAREGAPESCGAGWHSPGDAAAPPGHDRRASGAPGAGYERARDMLTAALRGEVPAATRRAVTAAAARLRSAAPSYRALPLPAQEGGGDAPAVALPVTRRADLLRFNHELQLEHATGLALQRSSGTTGERLVVYRTNDDLRTLVARYLLVLRALAPSRQPLVGFLDPGLDLCSVLPAIGPLRRIAATGGPAEQLEALERAGVEALYGFPAMVRRLALHLLRIGRSAPQIRLILLAGDLIDEPLRRCCASAFPAAELYGTYGCTETGLIAYECSAHAGFHVCEQDFLVAVQKEDGSVANAGRGGLLVSSGAWGGTPILNYALGDDVELTREPCGCGLRSARLVLFGRRSAGVRAPNGAWITPHACVDVLSAIAGVGAFQIRAGGASGIRLLVETIDGLPLPEPMALQAARRVQELFGTSGDVGVEPATLATGIPKVPLLVKEEHGEVVA